MELLLADLSLSRSDLALNVLLLALTDSSDVHDLNLISNEENDSPAGLLFQGLD